MRPADVPLVDRPMYYQGTLMRHLEHGIVQVAFEDLAVRVKPWKKGWMRSPLKHLDLFWLDTGYYVHKGLLYYVCRVPSRSTKKSTHPRYYLAHSMEGGGTFPADITMLHECAVNPPQYVTNLQEYFSSEGRYAILTPDIVMDGEGGVFFCGEEVGTYSDGKFVANKETTPYVAELMQETFDACS